LPLLSNTRNQELKPLQKGKRCMKTNTWKVRQQYVSLKVQGKAAAQRGSALSRRRFDEQTTAAG
jgi:hypothetical protein